VDPDTFTTGTRDTTEHLVSRLLPDDDPALDTDRQAAIRARSSHVELPETEPEKVTVDDVLYHIGTTLGQSGKGRLPAPAAYSRMCFGGLRTSLHPVLLTCIQSVCAKEPSPPLGRKADK